MYLSCLGYDIIVPTYVGTGFFIKFLFNFEYFKSNFMEIGSVTICHTR